MKTAKLILILVLLSAQISAQKKTDPGANAIALDTPALRMLPAVKHVSLIAGLRDGWTKEKFSVWFQAYGKADQLICKRGIGEGKTKDVPWILGKGFSWLDCSDSIKLLCPESLDAQMYECYSLREDFFKG